MELHISYFDVICVICCVAVLLWLLNRYLFQPISQVLDKREEIMQVSRDKAEKNLKIIENKISLYRSTISKEKDESNALLKETFDQALKDKAKTIAKAKKRNDEFIAQKLKEIQREEVHTQKHLDEKVASLAGLIIDNLLKQ
jgi:F0F1-type ATP synthase membrane subunit b/b'